MQCSHAHFLVRNDSDLKRFAKDHFNFLSCKVVGIYYNVLKSEHINKQSSSVEYKSVPIIVILLILVVCLAIIVLWLLENGVTSKLFIFQVIKFDTRDQNRVLIPILHQI